MLDGAHEIEALQFEVRAISQEIQEKYSGKEEFLTKPTEANTQLDCVPRRLMHCGSRQKSGFLGQVRDHKLMAEYNKKEEEM